MVMRWLVVRVCTLHMGYCDEWLLIVVGMFVKNQLLF